MKGILIIVGVLFVIGAVMGAALYIAFPNQMSDSPRAARMLVDG